MRKAFAAIAVATLAVLAAPGAQAARSAPAKIDFNSRASVMEWIDTYRAKPDPARVPAAVRALSQAGALRDPESAGYFVGFVAGVLGAEPRRAEDLVRKMLPLPAADEWFVVRAIAYSGLPAWQSLLARVAEGVPARRAMVEQYLTGKLPTLDAIELDKSPTLLEKVRLQFGGKPRVPAISYGHNPELLDTLWGVYFATGDYRPIWRIIAMLPWSKDRDAVPRLTAGSAAKYTLASNAARYPDVLAMLKDMARYQPKEVAPVLADVIRLAEANDAAAIRKAQLAALEELKRKGPGHQRDMKLWGYVGQGVIAVGCIAAASVSLTVLGLPCVIGGAVSSAVINYMAAQ
jgi:hypothetical protein